MSVYHACFTSVFLFSPRLEILVLESLDLGARPTRLARNSTLEIRGPMKSRHDTRDHRPLITAPRASRRRTAWRR